MPRNGYRESDFLKITKNQVRDYLFFKLGRDRPRQLFALTVAFFGYGDEYDTEDFDEHGIKLLEECAAKQNKECTSVVNLLRKGKGHVPSERTLDFTACLFDLPVGSLAEFVARAKNNGAVPHALLGH